MPSRQPVGLLGAFALLGCAHLEPRCSEYRQVLAEASAEVAITDQVRAGGAFAEAPAIDVSEEAALLSKRLKTLCELRWEGELSHDAYRLEVRQAYDDYIRTRFGDSHRY
ncbi:MAG: hypothetical protein AAF430_18125 [Myxococcota bacterium]